MQPLQTEFSAKRGVGTYLAGILNYLPAAARRHDLSFLFNASFPDAFFACRERFPFIDERNSSSFLQGIVRGYRHANGEAVRMGEGFYSAFVDELAPDLLFSANLQEGLDEPAITAFAAQSGRFSQVATLHDMVPLYYRDKYLADPATERWYHRKLRDASRCHHIVTVSDSSKRDIERFLGLTQSRITAVPNGYDHTVFTPERRDGELATVRAYLGYEGSFILYVGGSDPHKNLARLVQAFSRLPPATRSACRLVLAGDGISTSSDVAAVLSSTGCADQVLFPGYVPGHLLSPLLRAAELFVFPSTHEGFGLPALESMACGTATLGAAGSAVAEVIGNPTATFDALDVDAISARMGQVLGDIDLRRRLEFRGLERAGSFSWRRTTERLVDIFEHEHERRADRSRRFSVANRLAALDVSDVELLGRAAEAISQSLPEARKPRVLIDASSIAYYGGNSGIQRVVRALGRHLPKAVGDMGEVRLVYAEEGASRLHEISSFEALDGRKPDPSQDPPADLQAGDIILFADLHPGLAIRSEEQLQRLRVLGVKVYYIVYDLLPVLMPEKFWPALQQEFFRWLQAVSRADGLICISQTVASECAAYLARFGCRRPDKLRIGSFPLGSDIEAASAHSGQPSSTEQGTEELEIPGELKFLMVGTLEPRKGQEQTLLAFEQLWRGGRNWSLTIVGKQGWNTSRLAQRLRDHPENGNRLFWFDSASDEQLKRIYAIADCIICPSEGEGFGLPLIEAARAGKPVIARDIPIFKEVASAGAFYFENSQDPGVLARGLERWEQLLRAGGVPDSARMKPSKWQDAANAIALHLSGNSWTHEVEPEGLLDLRQPISLPNPNVTITGVYPDEGDIQWTGKQCTMAFRTAEKFDASVLKLSCHSWTSSSVSAFVNGRKANEFAVDGDVMEVSLPLGTLSAGLQNVRIIVDKAGTPKGDSRVLGIAIKSWEFQPRLTLTPGRWIDAHSQSLEWHGFSGLEADGRWTLGERSEVVFFLDDDLDAAITIYARSAKEMEFEFEVNGLPTFKKVVGSRAGLIQLPASRLKKGRNIFSILALQLERYSSQDSRKLGLSLLQINITP